MARVEITKADGRRIEGFEADVDPDDSSAAVGVLKRWAKQHRRDVGGLAVRIQTRKGWREYRA